MVRYGILKSSQLEAGQRSEIFYLLLLNGCRGGLNYIYLFVMLMIFILVFASRQLTYSQICSRNSSNIYQGYSSVFQVLSKSGGKFLIETKGTLQERSSSFTDGGMFTPSIFTFFIFGRMPNKWRASPQSP